MKKLFTIVALLLAIASQASAQIINAERFRSTTGPCVIRSGSGSPEGVVTGNVCDVYLRSNGSTDTTIYVKSSGTGNTGWLTLGGGGGAWTNPITSAAVAAIVSDETGTAGSLVFSNSPALTTPVLGDALATSLVTSGTTGATIYSNGSVAAGMTWQINNGSSATGSYSNIIASSGPLTASYFGATTETSSNTDAGGAARSWLDTNGNAGSGWDIISAASSGETRFYTDGYLSSNLRGTFSSAGLVINTGNLHLAGTTSSFPMLKRNSADIDFRLGDDSGYASLNAKGAIFNPTASGGGAGINRIGSGNGNGVFWGLGVTNAGGTDSSVFGQSSSAYTTGGSLGWLGNSMGFVYYPSSFRIGTGVGATPTVIFDSSLNTTLGGTLNFGGSTSSFPMLKRNSTQVEVKLADDSAFTTLKASALFIASNSYFQEGSNPTINLETTGTGYTFMRFANSSNTSGFGTDNSSGGGIFTGGTANATVIGNVSNVPMEFFTNNAKRFSFAGGGAAEFLVTTTISKNSIGTTSTDGAVLSNSTAAAAGAQQYAPRLRFRGNGWKTDATAASQAVEWYMEMRPQQGAANPLGNLVWAQAINSGSFADIMTLSATGTGTGDLSVVGSFLSGASVRAASGGEIFWNTRAKMTSPANSKIKMGNNASSTGVTLDMSTDGTMLLRNFADGADGNFTAGTVNASSSIKLNAVLADSATAPTIASGGCTSPAVTHNNGTAAFLITIGTSCTGVKTFVLTMPAAAHFWACAGENNTSDAQQQTNYIVARATSTTAVTFTSYDRVLGTQEDFTASDTYLIQCRAE